MIDNPVGTNTYIVGTGRDRILIDTGEGFPKWLDWLKEFVSQQNVNIRTVLLTHWHHDHISGVPHLLSLFPSATIYKNNPSLKGDPSTWKDIQNGQEFKTEGATLRALHCPGHTTDHMAFVLEEEDDAMFTGDNVLGHGTAVFEDMAAYMSSLEIMASKVGGRAYPGHGDVIVDGKQKIQGYISHRKERENQVLEVLNQASNKDKTPQVALTSMEIVKVIYTDVPETLHEAAQRGVVQILQKLVKDGKVEDVSEGRWRVRGAAANL